MHRFTAIALALAFFALTGCAQRQSVSRSWNGESRFKSRESIGALNTLANSDSASHAERARAIFALFANHIKPGATANDVHSVLTDTTWLTHCNLQGWYAPQGHIPFEGRDGTMFVVMLFPDDRIVVGGVGVLWTVCLRITFSEARPKEEVLAFLRRHAMPQDERSMSIALERLSEKEAVAFLAGDTSVPGKPRLEEFALTSPGTRGKSYDHEEQFSRRGILVYGDQ
jgi:hypothetical protein